MSTSTSFICSSDCVNSKLCCIPRTKYDFVGIVDEDGLRKEYGCQTWEGPFQHKYVGNFLFNNMHDTGFYFVRQENSMSCFDGQFYNNKLEGYGQVIHDDGSIYEGLFKNNKRFGPGVITHADGTQDVGFWNGNNLIRLSISASSDSIPTLCSSSGSKLKLLRFKKIVPTLPEREDQAKNMMLSLGVDENVLCKYPELYNYHVRNENSSFFDRRYYDLAQLGSEVASIEVIEEESLEKLNYDDNAAEDDDFYECSNERCAHLIKQIDEMKSELCRISDAIGRFQKQLKMCAKCCAVDELETERASVNSNSKDDSEDPTDIGNIKDLPKTNLTTSEISQKYQVTKDLNQMRLHSSIISLSEMSAIQENEVLVHDNAEKLDMIDNMVDDVSVNEVELQNHKSFEIIELKKYNETPEKITCDCSNEQVADIEVIELKEYENTTPEKITCTCSNEQVPDIDFIISELEILQKNEKFYKIVIKYLNSILCKEITSTTKGNTPKTIEIHVEHLLAWNNDKNIIDILHHCFRYRNYENMLTFSIKSLLIGDRTVFAKMGNQEKACIDFLKHCEINQLDKVKTDLLKHNMNPDLSDARGNAGIHFAVTHDSHLVIQQLANVGANLNAFNDECLTPLLLAILRYISAINNVHLWETAFLPDVVLNSEELKEVTQWRPHESLVSLGEFMGSSSHLLRSEISFSRKGNRMSCDETSVDRQLIPPRKSSPTTRPNLTYLLSTYFIDDYIKHKKTYSMKQVEEVDQKQIESIGSTIATLLHFGADPNAGEVPMCPILLAIFTKNAKLVEILLENGADPSTVNEGGLSALHILACLPFSSDNTDISEKFLNYGCDPNRKTRSDYWLEHNGGLIGQYFKLKDNRDNIRGKTPIQLICMRNDFDEENIEHQCNLVRTLIEHGATYGNYYLGHTLLSIAVLRKNVELIDTLYPYIEGGRPLGENMGNVLTLLGLTRFSSARAFTRYKETIDRLISLGMNPFDSVYTFPNVFEFFSKEYSQEAFEKNRKIRVKLEAEYKKFAKNFGNKEVATISNKMSVAYMTDIGRNILSIIYQYKAMLRLLVLAEKNCLNNKHGQSLAKFLSIDDALKCMKIMIHFEKMELDSELKELLMQILEFIRDRTKPRKSRKKKKTKPLNLQEAVEKLKDYKIEIPRHVAKYLLDINNEKYDVCYHCLKKSKKILFLCPSCGIVKFCSQICNKFNKKSKKLKHPCKILFYNRMKNNLIQFDFNEALCFSEKDNQKQESDSSSGTTSYYSISEITQEEEDERATCCFRKNSLLILCNENEYSNRRTINCGFLCGQNIPAEEANLDEDEFCVCYPPYRNDFEIQRLRNIGYDRMKLMKKIPKTRTQVTGDDNMSRNHNELFTSQHEYDQIYGGKSHISTMNKYETYQTGIQKSNTENNGKQAIEKKSQTDTNKTTESYGVDSSTPKNMAAIEGEMIRGNQMDLDKLKNRKNSIQKSSNNDEIKLMETGKENFTRELNKNRFRDVETKRKDEAESTLHANMSKYKGQGNTKKPNKNFSGEIEAHNKLTEGSELDEKYNRNSKKHRLFEADTRAKNIDAKMMNNKELERSQKARNKLTKGNEFDEENYGKNLKKRAETRSKNRQDGTGDTDGGEVKLKQTHGGQEATLSTKIKPIKRQHERQAKDSNFDKIGMKKDKENTSHPSSKEHKDHEKSRSPNRRNYRDEDQELKGMQNEEKDKRKAKTKEWKTQNQMKESGKGKFDENRATEKTVVSDAGKKHDRIRSKSPEKDMKSMKWAKSELKESERTTNVKYLKGQKGTDIAGGRAPHDTSNFAKSQKFPKVHQYFLQLLTKYFPEFDLNGILLPFACFVDGQLYYKFTEKSPYYCRTYSTI